jgi:hypothetical protein
MVGHDGGTDHHTIMGNSFIYEHVQRTSAGLP